MEKVNARQRWLAEGLLVCVAAGWGIGFPVMKSAVDVYPVLMVLFLRFLLSTLLMLPLTGKKLLRVQRSTLMTGVLLGTLLGATYLLLIFGLQQTSAASTGFLAGLNVIWVLLLAALLAGRFPGADAWLATGCALLGLALMSDISSLQLRQGDLLVIAGSFFSALHILALDRWSGRHDTLTLTVIQIATMTVMMLLALLGTGQPLFPDHVDTSLLTALLITAVFSTVFAFWVQTHYQRFTTPTRAILIYNLDPVFSALFAVWLLHETLSDNIVTGGAFILLGMCLPGVLSTFVQRYRVRKVAN